MSTAAVAPPPFNSIASSPSLSGESSSSTKQKKSKKKRTMEGPSSPSPSSSPSMDPPESPSVGEQESKKTKKGKEGEVETKRERKKTKGAKEEERVPSPAVDDKNPKEASVKKESEEKEKDVEVGRKQRKSTTSRFMAQMGKSDEKNGASPKCKEEKKSKEKGKKEDDDAFIPLDVAEQNFSSFILKDFAENKTLSALSHVKQRALCADYSLAPLQNELETLCAANEEYAKTNDTFEKLRSEQFSRIGDHIYVDYTGSSLYPVCLLHQHIASLENQVYGNPHSLNPSSLLSTQKCDAARIAVGRYFNADPEEYDVIFTSNASHAARHVGESFPWGKRSTFAYLLDNHTSVLGIREFAAKNGAKVKRVNITEGELTVEMKDMDKIVKKSNLSDCRLFAYPLQSNGTGIIHSTDLISFAQSRGWYVLLDVAAYVPTHRVDLSVVKPDFMCLSFYKMFGYPTGIGALIAKRKVLKLMTRPTFSGGTISISSARANIAYMFNDHEGFEDGTINFLGIPAIAHGLSFFEKYVDSLEIRCRAHVKWLNEKMSSMRHPRTKSPLFVIHGLPPPSSSPSHTHGCTILFSMFDENEMRISHWMVDQQATKHNISLRVGCFCNPGVGETSLHIPPSSIVSCCIRNSVHPAETRIGAIVTCIGRKYPVGMVRISVGLSTVFADCYRLIQFFEKFLDPEFVVNANNAYWSTATLPHGLC